MDLVHFIEAVAKGAPQPGDVHPQRRGLPKGLRRVLHLPLLVEYLKMKKYY